MDSSQLKEGAVVSLPEIISKFHSLYSTKLGDGQFQSLDTFFFVVFWNCSVCCNKQPYRHMLNDLF
jgi:hypothetical protein